MIQRRRESGQWEGRDPSQTREKKPWKEADGLQDRLFKITASVQVQQDEVVTALSGIEEVLLIHLESSLEPIEWIEVQLKEMQVSLGELESLEQETWTWTAWS